MKLLSFLTKFFKINILIAFFLFVLILDSQAQGSFLNEQLRHRRVTQASTKDYQLQRDIESRNLPYPPRAIYLRAFKKEGTLEVWLPNYSGTYTKYKEYTVCASSGLPGPKRLKGDKQVPEGFYHIDRFNPTSSYHLSLGINYPNQSDKMLGLGRGMGGDIFIHGDCKTIGCLPLTNDKMEEVYWLAAQARNSGQYRIPVHIFPYKFDNYDFDQEERGRFTFNRKVTQLWDNLKTGYYYFENNRRPPQVNIRYDGFYEFF